MGSQVEARPSGKPDHGSAAINRGRSRDASRSPSPLGAASPNARRISSSSAGALLSVGQHLVLGRRHHRLLSLQSVDSTCAFIMALYRWTRQSVSCPLPGRKGLTLRIPPSELPEDGNCCSGAGPKVPGLKVYVAHFRSRSVHVVEMQIGITSANGDDQMNVTARQQRPKVAGSDPDTVRARSGGESLPPPQADATGRHGGYSILRSQSIQLQVVTISRSVQQDNREVRRLQEQVRTSSRVAKLCPSGLNRTVPHDPYRAKWYRSIGCWSPSPAGLRR